MTSIDPRADNVVRDAVDAFMDGRLVPDFSGETVFETKNSRYRLRDGVVVAAPDASLVGAELVGWLCESSRRLLVESAWQQGARAVLVDRARARNIIVTSATRILHLDDGASYPEPPPHELPSWRPPPIDPGAPAPPPFSPRNAPILASTPPPPLAAPEPAPPPKRTIPPPVAVPPPSPFMSAAAAAAAPKRGGAHLPPRPIAMGPQAAPNPGARSAPAMGPQAAPNPGARSAPAMGPQAAPNPGARSAPAIGSRPRAAAAPRPLPAPVPPPRRNEQAIVPAPPAIPVGLAPIDPPAWELTSAELEVVEPPSSEPATVERPDTTPCQAEDAIPFELARHADHEPVNSEPFPLVRPLDGSAPPSRR